MYLDKQPCGDGEGGTKRSKSSSTYRYYLLLKAHKIHNYKKYNDNSYILHTFNMLFC